MSKGTKIFSVVSVALLLALALGWKSGGQLTLVKFIISISTLYLGVVSYRTKQYFWLLFFGFITVLFFPFQDIFSLSYIVWRIIDLIVAVGVTLFFYLYYDSYRKGANFEKFIISLFPQELWVIEDLTKDKSKILNREVESDRNPDITVRSLNNNKRFAIECKFRSRFWDNGGKSAAGISWRARNHDSYKKYGEKENIPVRIIFGVGGNPKHPSRIFVVPIEKIEEYKGKIIPAQYLSQFERNPKMPISLD